MIASSATLTATSRAAGIGVNGIVVTDTPATYDDGVYTCSRLTVPWTPLLRDGSMGWIAQRLRMLWSSASMPDAGPIASSIQAPSATDGQFDVFRLDATTWRFDCSRNTVQTRVPVTDAGFADGDPQLLVSQWTPTTVQLSTNGSAFSTVARGGTGNPSNLPASLDIGSLMGTSLFLDSTTVWFACGVGSLAATDVANLLALGDTAPGPQAFPATAKLTGAWQMVPLLGEPALARIPILRMGR